MDFGIADKKALVCAASKGIGKAIATALVQEGVEVFLCARNPETLSQTVKELKKLTDKPIHELAIDLTDHTAREQLINTVENTMGKPDIVIHNVGGPPPSIVEETSLDDWQAGFERLFISIAHLNQAFLPHMKEKKWGRILAVTSISVVEPIPYLAVSNGIRAGLTSMLKALSTDVAPYGITVNCLAPGYILTDRMTQLIQSNVDKGEDRDIVTKRFTDNIPMGRMGDPAEMGNTAAYLCSKQASYITGQTLLVDGGRRKAIF